MDGPRRSLRKREEKSYAESPDLIIEEDRSVPRKVLLSSTNQTNHTGSGSGTAHHGNSDHSPAVDGAHGVLNNGDVHMESEEEQEEDEVSAPVNVMVPPKVIFQFQKAWFYSNFHVIDPQSQ